MSEPTEGQWLEGNYPEAEADYERQRLSLQDHIDRFIEAEGIDGRLVLDYEQAVVDAARRIANLDIEAATPVIYELRYVKDGDDWDDQIEDITRRAVEIALGISE